MTRRRKKERRPSRLDRIERKCDRILSELIILRQRGNNRPDIDTAIEALHKSACMMREQAYRERDRVYHQYLGK